MGGFTRRRRIIAAARTRELLRRGAHPIIHTDVRGNPLSAHVIVLRALVRIAKGRDHIVRIHIQRIRLQRRNRVDRLIIELYRRLGDRRFHDALAGKNGGTGHIGIITEVNRDENGNLISFKFIHSSSSKGPQESTYNVGGSRYYDDDDLYTGYYAWDTEDTAPR